MGSEKDIPCVVCDQNVAGTVWLLCAACEVPAHKDCWDARGSCPVFGCGSKETIDPAAAIFRKKPGAAVVARAGIAGDAASAQALAVRREIDALEVAETARQDRQARLFGVALAGWAASLVIASSIPAFYMLGAAWFLAFLGAAGWLEVRGWLAERRRRELENGAQGGGAAAR